MRGAIRLAPVLLLAGCAAPTAVLLPGEDGHPTGALAVLGTRDGDQVLDKPLLAARMSAHRTTIRQVTKVKPAYRELLATLPPPPKTFRLYFIEGTTTIVPSSRDQLEQLRAEVARRWRLDEIDAAVRASQRRRRLVADALATGEPTAWDFQPFRDASKSYMRNTIPLDELEAKARFPRVSP